MELYRASPNEMANKSPIKGIKQRKAVNGARRIHLLCTFASFSSLTRKYFVIHSILPALPIMYVVVLPRIFPKDAAVIADIGSNPAINAAVKAISELNGKMVAAKKAAVKSEDNATISNLSQFLSQ